MTNTNEITFEINGATYTRKANGYCYVSYEYSESGKVHRIGKNEFEAKYAQFQTEEAMEGAVEIEVTELEPNEGEMVYHDEPIERIDIEAAVEATEESETTEEIQEIAKEFAPVELEPAVINEFGCVDCRNCPVDKCVHRDCMRRNPTSVGGLGECPRLKVKKQESPKKKRARKSKDIAYEGHEVTLTAKQVDFIRHLSDTCFWENGLDSKVWVDCLCDDIKGQFEGKPMTTGAMISTLCEKGLGIRAKEKVNNRTATYFELTPTGKMVATELGLN